MITLWDSLLSCRYRVQSKGQIESLQQLGIQASLQYTLTTDCLYFIFLIRIFNKETSSRLDFFALDVFLHSHMTRLPTFPEA